jgi:hypothetical protein
MRGHAWDKRDSVPIIYRIRAHAHTRARTPDTVEKGGSVPFVPARRTGAQAPDLDAFAERAAIAEHDGGMTRADAEALAAAEQGYPSAAALMAASGAAT